MGPRKPPPLHRKPPAALILVSESELCEADSVARYVWATHAPLRTSGPLCSTPNSSTTRTARSGSPLVIHRQHRVFREVSPTCDDPLWTKCMLGVSSVQVNVSSTELEASSIKCGLGATNSEADASKREASSARSGQPSSKWWAGFGEGWTGSAKFGLMSAKPWADRPNPRLR